MSLKPIDTMLGLIDIESSTNEKVVLIREYLNISKLFKLVITMALDPMKKYHIKKFPEYKPNNKQYHLKELFQHLNYLSNKPGATADDKQKLSEIASSFDEETYATVQKIVKKDLRCGASASNVNKAQKGLIPVIPYMRCRSHKHLDKMKFPLIAQEKSDGMFVNIIIKGKNKINFVTRNGSPVHQMQNLVEELRTLTKFKDTILLGEMLVWNEDFTAYLDRKTGNGVLNKCLKNTCPPEFLKRIALKVWDAIPVFDFWNGTCLAKHRDRFNNVRYYVEVARNKRYINTVRVKYVYDKEELDQFYKRIRSEGGEGCVVKDDHGPWKNSKSGTKWMCKMKAVYDAEVYFTHWEPGAKGTKYEGCVGTLHFKTACGKLTGSVGTGPGLTDTARGYKGIQVVNGEKIHRYSPGILKRWDNLVGTNQAIQLEFNELLINKQGEYSLFLPSFQNFRKDKSEVDTLEFLIDKCSVKEEQ